MKRIQWGLVAEAAVLFFAAYLLVLGVRAEDNSIESLKYFFFGFSLLIQGQIRDVARRLEKISGQRRYSTLNIFVTKDEYEKSMLIHAEQQRQVVVESSDD